MTRPNHDFKPGHLTMCQVCNSRDLELALALGHQAPCHALLSVEQLHQPEATYPLNMIRCRACGLMQLDYIIDGREVYYPDYPYRSGITKELADHHHRLSTDVVKRFDVSKDSLVVDIGSNDGTLLRGFQRQGMRVLGVEPTNIARIAVAEGIDTVQGFFTERLGREIAGQYGTAKIVTATNVFAHMAELGSFIRGV